MKWRLVYFVQGFTHSLWWLRSPEIITRNSVLVPLAHAIISMLGLAPLFIPLVHARPFICKQNKCIQIRQHHILMNISILTKKRKYLVIQLTCTSSSNWPSMSSSRGCGCNNGIDVLIRKRRQPQPIPLPEKRSSLARQGQRWQPHGRGKEESGVAPSILRELPIIGAYIQVFWCAKIDFGLSHGLKETV